MNRTPWVLGLCLVFAASSVACDRAATQEGEQGNIEFSYQPADGVRDFERPIAVGSIVEIELEPLGSLSMERITSATSAPSNIFDIEIGEEQNIFVRGAEAGTATVEVEATGNSTTYSDRITLHADHTDRLSMAHECTRYPDAAYLIGDEPELEFERFNAEGDKLVGRSDADTAIGCDVVMNPPFFESQAHCDEGGMRFQPITEAGTISIDLVQGVSTAGSSSQYLELHIVQPEVLDFLAAEGSLRTGISRDIQLNPVVYPVNSTEVWTVCSHLDYRVEILTPHTCTGRNGNLTFTVDARDENEVTLRGQDPGVCEFAVELRDHPQMGEWIFSANVRD